jgi:general secretion pathway protein D/MSHA biogenesis protein MshL
MQNRNQEGRTTVVQGTGIGSREGFYFTIDKPLGIITVTAPRSILEKVSDYVEHLREELNKQVIIEAKILEVQLDNSSTKGIDWSELLKDSKFNFLMTFGKAGQIYPTEGVKFLESVTMTRDSFDLVLNFLDEFGTVNVLSNPKISLLNGQPAMILAGKPRAILTRSQQ